MEKGRVLGRFDHAMVLVYKRKKGSGWVSKIMGGKREGLGEYDCAIVLEYKRKDGIFEHGCSRVRRVGKFNQSCAEGSE